MHVAAESGVARKSSQLHSRWHLQLKTYRQRRQGRMTPGVHGNLMPLHILVLQNARELEKNQLS